MEEYGSQNLSAIAILGSLIISLVASYFEFKLFFVLWSLFILALMAGSVLFILNAFFNADFTANENLETTKQRIFDRTILVYFGVSIISFFINLISYFVFKVDLRKKFYFSLSLYMILSFLGFVAFSTESGLLETNKNIWNGIKLALSSVSSGAFVRYAVATIIYVFMLIALSDLNMYYMDKLNTKEYKEYRIFNFFHKYRSYVFNIASSIVIFALFVDVFQTSWVFPEPPTNEINPNSLFVLGFITSVIFAIFDVSRIPALLGFLILIFIMFFSETQYTPQNYSVKDEVKQIDFWGIDPIFVGVPIIILLLVFASKIDWYNEKDFKNSIFSAKSKITIN